jgi:dolichol kinase
MDGTAPLVGKRFPAGFYRTFGKVQYKTVSGSIGMLVATLMGVGIFRAGIGVPAELGIAEVLGMALAATVVEALSGKWDNPLIAGAVWYYMQFKS